MRRMSISPLQAMERGGLKGFGFSVTFHEPQSSKPSPSPEARTTAEPAASGSVPRDDASTPLPVSGPIPGDVR